MIDSLSLVERIASWSHLLDLSAVPDDVNKAAKRCIVDFIGVAIAGVSCPQSRHIYDYAKQTYAPGSATILGFSDRLSPVGAALINGTVGHALDFDDTSYTGIMHGSTVVLPAALAAAEFANADGRRFLESYVVGAEVAYAVGLLCTTSHYYKGWWATATLGAFGAAAAASKAMDLSELQTTIALSLAGIQACGLKVLLGTDAKPYLAGRAAAIGVEAALLASSGYNAPSAIFEDRYGFIQVLNDGVVNNDGIDKLGIDWRLINPGIFFKQYPVCSAAHAAVELTQHLLEKNKLQSKSIQKVICEVPPLVALSLIYDKPRTLEEARFSLPFAVGTMLASGQLGIENLTNEALVNRQIQMEMSKVEMRRVDSLQNTEAPECARITLLTDDGRELTGYLGDPMGMPTNPMSDDQIHDKFLRCTAVGGMLSNQSTTLLKHLTTIESASSALIVL